MSALLIACAVLIVIDRLLTIRNVGRWLTVTGRSAALYTISGAIVVVVMLLAAFRGVTP